jgi:hypothetical protein
MRGVGAAADTPSHEPRRGPSLLLEHCERLERMMSSQPRPARDRLELAVGPELATALIRLLTGVEDSAGRGEPE